MIDALCTAVVNQLNAHAWSPSIAVEFDDAPEFAPDDLKELRVTLMPADKQQEVETRGHDKYKMAIEICFQQKAGPRPLGGNDPIKEMRKQITLLQETVADWLSSRENRRPPNYLTAYLLKIEQKPIYDAELLRSKRHYIGIMRLEYEEIRRPT